MRLAHAGMQPHVGSSQPSPDSDVRIRAEAVLQSLLAAKAECEKHLAKQNRSDAMKEVSGASSIERAITSTRQLIRDLDASMSKPGVVVEVRGAGRRAQASPGAAVWSGEAARVVANAR